MKRRILAIAMILAMTATLFLTGCGGGSEGGSDENRTLIMRTKSTFTTLDWSKCTDTHAQKLYNQIYEGLYGMDEAEGDYYNLLAKDVTISDDQMRPRNS